MTVVLHELSLQKSLNFKSLCIENFKDNAFEGILM